MKKVKSALLGLAAVSVVGLAACGGNTTPTTTTPAPTTTTTQAAKTYEKDNTKHREVIDATAGTYGDWEAHTWGEWTVTKEATLTEKGSKNHTCTVCGQNVVEEIAKILPEAGKTEAATAVYAVVPETWENANIYYWSHGDADHADEEEIVAASKTSWPGEAMTLVDEETNLYGFKVPANTYHIIFNNGSEQTADLDYAPSANLFTLTEKSDGKYLADYGTYTPKATDPELATKEFKEYDLYFKLEKELADGEAFHIYYFGGMSADPWPGKELSAEVITEVSSTDKIYKIHVSADSTFIVNLGDGKLQTENIKPVTSADENLIIVKNATKTVPDGKDAQGNPKTKDMLVAAVGKYDNGTVTEFEPVKLHVQMLYELAEGDVPHMHSWGGKYEHAAWPGLEMTLVEGTTNEYEVELPYGSNGFIVNLGEGKLQTENMSLQEGQNAFIIKAATKEVADGKDAQGNPKTKTVLDYSDATFENGQFDVIEVVQQTAEDFYIRGTITNWAVNEEFKLTPNTEKTVATIDITVEVGDKFKAAKNDWAIVCAYNDSLPAAFKDDGSNDHNIEVVTAGRYTVTITITNNAPVLTIAAVPANQA